MFQHRRQHGADRAHIAKALGLQHRQPILVIKGKEVAEIRQRHGIHHSINPAMALQDARRHGIHRSTLGKIHRLRLMAQRLQLRKVTA
jgi:hypothetical protein